MVISYPSKEFDNIFFAEILIILGVGTWPNTYVRHMYKWGQLLMLSIFVLRGLCVVFKKRYAIIILLIKQSMHMNE